MTPIALTAADSNQMLCCGTCMPGPSARSFLARRPSRLGLEEAESAESRSGHPRVFVTGGTLRLCLGHVARSVSGPCVRLRVSLWHSVHWWLECGLTNGTHGLVQVRPHDLGHLIWQLSTPAYQLRRSSRLRLMTGHVLMSGVPGVKSSWRPGCLSLAAASEPSLRSAEHSGKTVLQ